MSARSRRGTSWFTSCGVPGANAGYESCCSRCIAVSTLCTKPRVLLLAGAFAASACGIDVTSGATDVTVVSDASVVPDAGLPPADATDAVTDTRASGARACASAQDCLPLDHPIGAVCCMKGTCIDGEAAEDAFSCPDGSQELILASDYDQSCQTESDCVLVPEGNFCYPGTANCPIAAINKGAYPQYQAAIAKTIAAICIANTGCPLVTDPCCKGGLCRTRADCLD